MSRAETYSPWRIARLGPGKGWQLTYRGELLATAFYVADLFLLMFDIEEGR